MLLRDLLATGEPTIGGWSLLSDPLVAELLARSGLDWVGIDLQHGTAGLDHLPDLLRAVSFGGRPAWVRVPSNDPSAIGRALDFGAQGIIVPMIDGPDDAARAVAACRYAPAGARSWGPVGVGQQVDGYSPDLGDRRAVCAVMIETLGGFASLHEILAVPGLDAVFVGPSDLALSHGMVPTMDVRDPRHRAMIERVAGSCAGTGIVPGIYAGSFEMITQWLAVGYRFFAIDSDTDLLRASLAGIVRRVRALADERARSTPQPTK